MTMALSVPTPHNSAASGDFEKTVLMPGDPNRAKLIAENYLDDVRIVTEVRGIIGYTGRYKSVPVSVMASGMGIPSVGIYSYELYSAYGVENIIRVGSIGAMQPGTRLRDIIIGIGACTNSNYAFQYGLKGTFAPTASYELTEHAVDIAREKGIRYHIGNILSTDTFYCNDPESNKKWAEMGVLGVEMEAAGLYMNAARLGRRALAICTVSDHIFTGESLPSADRERTFTQMIELGLETASRL